MSSIPLYLDTTMVMAADLYGPLLRSTGIVELVAVSRAVLLATAKVRRDRRLKLPGAIHLPTAIATGCRLFLTQDLAWRSIPTVTVMSQLDPGLAPRLDGCLA